MYLEPQSKHAFGVDVKPNVRETATEDEVRAILGKGQMMQNTTFQWSLTFCGYDQPDSTNGFLCS